ncbi:hypothetical protein CPB84DRAFT_1782296 [Gymnopilus junonius]|uniref:Uncharacterized protein n=1 Tax=Gymnopilus junonius TaxID=109634 RepID=A0A9P5NII9_GYMJU|nr:hypothetical protein CPB84DRAFT_1782296 [Gymnopilus junonius]
MPQQNPARQGITFFGMVGTVMALLKLKGKYDEYVQAAADEEEGRVRLTSPSTDDIDAQSHITLLDTQIPNSARRTKKKKTCCMCCGYDCTLLWKAIGIVVGLYTLYFAFKTIRWALTPAPTGLEGLPAFGSSLGCLDAPYIYNKSEVTMSLPLGTLKKDHAFDVRGSGVGTITVLDGDADSTEVKYEFTIRSNDENLIDKVALVYPDINSDNTVSRSQFVIETSQVASPAQKQCTRFDVKMYVPPNLQKLHVASHSPAQVKFAPGTRAKIAELFVTLFSLDSNNMIVASPDVVADKTTLEVYRGWIVGEASIANELDVTTQRGDGVANLKITPTLPTDASSPEKVTLRTTTGAGRSDFTFIGRKEFKRQIESTHTSSKNADMYLTYRQADFNGKINLQSKSYTATGAQRLPMKVDQKWTHFVEDEDGKDTIMINSRGWTGLYF